MRFSGCVGLLLLLFAVGIVADDPEENTISNTTVVPLVTSETVIESTVLTTNEETTISRTTIGTPPQPLIGCDKLPSTNITTIINCVGTDIKFENFSNVLDLSEYSPEQLTQVLYKSYRGKIMAMTIRSSVTVHSSNHSSISLSADYEMNLKPYYQITDNDMLEELEIKTSKTFWIYKKPVVIVKGNKKLNATMVQKLKDQEWFDEASIIQDPGECRMKKPYLETFEYLNGCGYFDGDLEITGNTDGDIPKILDFGKINGCLRIKNTTITNVKFINNVSINCVSSSNEITGNGGLCLTSEESHVLEEKLKPLILKENSKCADICSVKWAKANNDDTNIACTKIVGLLEISNHTDENDLKYLWHVEEIEGRVLIHHNTLKTFSFFPNLKRIKNNAPDEISLNVLHNENMEVFSIPSLESIENPGSTVTKVSFYSNGEFVFTEDEAAKIYKLGAARLPIAQKERPKETATVAREADDSHSEESGSTTSSKEVVGEGVTEGLSTGAIVGISIGAYIVGGIVLGILVALIIVLVKRIRRIKIVKRKEKNNVKEVTKPQLVIIRPPPAKPINERNVTNNTKVNVTELRNPTTDFSLLSESESQYFKEKQAYMKNRFFTYNKSKKHDEKDVKTIKYSFNLDTKDLEKNEGSHTPTFVHTITTDWYKTESLQHFEKEPTNANFDDIMQFFKVNLTRSPNTFTYKTVQKILDHLSTDVKQTTRTSQLVKLNGPCHFIGDINGSIFDLYTAFSVGKGSMLQKKYVFCGNYMGGVKSDLQCLLLLLVMSKTYEHIVLLRGINEYGTRAQSLLNVAINSHFPELSKHEKDKLINAFLEIFNKMPLGALVNEKILAVHGGISERMLEKQNIDALFEAIPMPLPPKPTAAVTKLVEDILYSEPNLVSHPITALGAGCYFNERVLRKFRKTMKIDLVVTGRADTGFAVLMNHRLIQLCGCFDYLLAKHGVHNAARKKEIRDLLKERKNILPAVGALRVNGDGTLTMMGIIHYDIDRAFEIDYRVKKKTEQLCEPFELEIQELKYERNEQIGEVNYKMDKAMFEHRQIFDEFPELRCIYKTQRIDLPNIIRLYETGCFDYITEREGIDMYVLTKVLTGVKPENKKRTRQDVFPECYGFTDDLNRLKIKDWEETTKRWETEVARVGKEEADKMALRHFIRHATSILKEERPAYQKKSRLQLHLLHKLNM